MSAYTKWNVPTLRDECESRGLIYDGLRKKDLIDLLRRNDDEAIEGDARSQDSGPGEVENDDVDDEIEMGGAHGSMTRVDTENVSMYPAVEEDQPQSIQEMQLQLALVRAQTTLKERELELQREVAAQRGNGDAAVNFERTNDFASVKQQLPCMKDEDALCFFLLFERVMQLNGVPKTQWAKFLGPQLSVKATRAFLRLPNEDARDYDIAKREILSYFQLDSKSYLHAFRSTRREGRETYRMLLSRLRDLQGSYFESANIDNFDSLADAMLAEQMFNILPPSVREFVYGKRPVNAEQIAAEADLAFQCSKVNEGMTPRFDVGHRFGVGHANASQFKPKFTPRLTDTRFRHAGVNNGIVPRPPMQRMGWRPQGPAHIPVQRPAAKVCWTCSSGGHTSKNCPQRNFCAPQCVLCGKVHNANSPCPVGGQNAAYSVCDHNSRPTFDFEYVIPTFINDVPTRALRDTGHNGVLIVDPDLVRSDQYVNGKSVRVIGAFDTHSIELPVAQILFRSPKLGCNLNLLIEVAVARMPQHLGCNIGNQLFHMFPQLIDIINQTSFPKF